MTELVSFWAVAMVLLWLVGAGWLLWSLVLLWGGHSQDSAGTGEILGGCYGVAMAVFPNDY